MIKSSFILTALCISFSAIAAEKMTVRVAFVEKFGSLTRLCDTKPVVWANNRMVLDAVNSSQVWSVKVPVNTVTISGDSMNSTCKTMIVKDSLGKVYESTATGGDATVVLD